MPNARRMMRRTLPVTTIAAALLVAPVVSMTPALGNPTPPKPAKETRVDVSDVPEVSVQEAGPATSVEPDTTTRAVAPGGTAGDADDVVTDLELPHGGGLIALSWDRSQTPAATTDLLMRTFGSDGWSEWSHIRPTDDDDPSAVKQTRVGTEPFWVPDASRLQLRADKGQRVPLRNAEVTVITPATTPAAPSAPAASAQAAPVNPRIITRAEWGANEALRAGCVPSWADTTRAVVIHHTAGSNSYSPDQSAGIVRGVLQYHTQTLGWCDIGYNALVDKYGQIFEGRYGGLKNPVVGAHALGFNYRTFGVSVLGNFDSSGLPSAARDALTSIIAMRVHDYYLNPVGNTQLVSADSGSRYPRGQTVTLPVITGHRDTYYTACPGGNIYALLGTIRWEVNAKASYGDSPVYQLYQHLGGARTLGEVATGEQTVFGRQVARFGDGTSIFSRFSGGAARLGPGFDWYYRTYGSTAWGDPGGEYPVPGGSRSDFAGSMRSLVWSPAYSVQQVRDGFQFYWSHHGASGAFLGVPVASEAPFLSGSTQVFSGARLWWSPGTDVHETHGAIRGLFEYYGGPYSFMGFPLTDEQPLRGGVSQTFTGARIWWSPASGAHETRGDIRARYESLGGPASQLGYPISDAVPSPDGSFRQWFQGNTIYWSARTGAVVGG